MDQISDRPRVEANRVEIVNHLSERREQAHQRNDTEHRYAVAGVTPNFERMSQRKFPDELGNGVAKGATLIHSARRILAQGSEHSLFGKDNRLSIQVGRRANRPAARARRNAPVISDNAVVAAPMNWHAESTGNPSPLVAPGDTIG